MSSIFDYLGVNDTANRSTSMWNETSMNRSTLKAFLKMQESGEGTQESYLQKFISASTDKLDELREITGEQSDEADKDKGITETYIQKFINASTKKLSKENEKLSSYSTQVSDSVKRLEDEIEKKGIKAEEEEDGKDSTYDAAKTLVDTFNKLAEQIRNSGNKTVSGKWDFIDKMTEAFKSRLDKVGITEKEDGSLSIDKEKFDSASPRELERALGKKDSFATFIDEQSKQLAAYAQTDAYQNASAYSNGGNLTTISNINGAFMNMLG